MKQRPSRSELTKRVRNMADSMVSKSDITNATVTAQYETQLLLCCYDGFSGIVEKRDYK